MARSERRGRRRQRGSVMVMAALAATALVLFAALAVDVGLIWSARTQSQNVSDSAALAAAANMIDQSGPSVTLAASRAAAQQYAAANSTVANPSVVVRNQDIVFGNWDLQTRTLDTGVDLSDPDVVTGVEVTVLMDDAVNAQSPAFLSRLAGRQGYEVKNRAIGYLGFEGSFATGEFELPIAIDSCDLVSDTDGCGDDYCETVSNPPNPCTLDDPQAGDGEVTCLEFSSTGEQNACWTVFDGDSPSVSTNKLRDIIDNGNPNDTSAGDKVFLDNGDKSPTTRRIRDRFYGDGPYNGNPSGTDRYPPFNAPPKSDSWVVKLPVVECQDDAHCAGGSPFAITGGVCFEIREVLSPPYDSDRLIKGRFLCPNSADSEERELFEEFCADEDDDPPDAPGGCNFGFRADRVVLVE